MRSNVVQRLTLDNVIIEESVLMENVIVIEGNEIEMNFDLEGIYFN